MEKNIDFARGKLKKEENERFWETLVKKLNACPDGPVKDTSKWKQASIQFSFFLFEIIVFCSVGTIERDA